MHYKVKNKDLDLKVVNELAKDLQIPLLMAGMLNSRGLSNLDDALLYLDPGKDLFDPFLLKDMDAAVERIIRAMNKNEKIFICGDYDVDGITSTSILMRFFKRLNYPIYHKLPSQTEGHGLSVEGIKKIKSELGNLIITVDNGSTSYEAVDYANDYGIDVIITDHHDISNQGVPKALAVINPKQNDCKSPFKYLSGGGLALYLALAIAKKMNRKDLIKNDLFVLASISTVADVAPLTEDNRKIVKRGLNAFFDSEILGLKLLLETESQNLSFSSRDISFKVAPKINAAGKFGFADDAISLLTESNYQILAANLKKLLSLNSARKDLVNSIAPELVRQGREAIANGDRIVIVSSNHNSAVNGLVASRLTEQFQKPTIVISFKDNVDEGRASCRSVDGFNIQEAIEALAKYHLGGGGHYMAAGLSIRRDQVAEFKKQINEYAEKSIKPKTVKTWMIDAEVSSTFLTEKVLNGFQMMEPFGAKNPTPLFKIRGIQLFRDENSRRVYYNSRLGDFVVKIYKNLENTMGDIPLNKSINVIAELSSEDGVPLLIIKDFELI
jgi:single-stranded-DNA-specific exonuclease